MSRLTTKKAARPVARKRPESIRIVDPVRIDEDEADYLVAKARENEPTISFEELLAKHGYELARDRRKVR